MRHDPLNLRRFLLGVFFTFAPVGLVTDIMSLGAYSPLEILAWSSLSGLVAVGFVYAKVRDLRLLPAVILLQALCLWFLLSEFSSRSPLPAASLQVRMFVDATAAVIVLSVGYSWFVSFIVNEGAEHFRLRTEAALARELHGGLVPPVAVETGGYEAYGRCFPGKRVGGDLVDLVLNEGVLTGYVAGVSGSGVPAGTLMAMLKSAARMRLRDNGALGDFLADLNEVLLPLKKPDMLVSCAIVRPLEGEARYATAGHPPILHYDRETRSVTRLARGRVPLGLLGDQAFGAATARMGPGDILALVSAGLADPASAEGDTFGLGRIEALVREHAEGGLLALFDSIMGAARAHGPQRDDQTLLLIRALTVPPPLITIF